MYIFKKGKKLEMPENFVEIVPRKDTSLIEITDVPTK